MKLTLDIIKPYMAEGHPEDIAKNPDFLEMLKNIEVVEGCTSEYNAIEYLKLFFKKENLVQILVKVNRFDVLVNKNLENGLLAEGKYLEEIYETITTKFHKELQPRYLARFCVYGQTYFLVEKNAWDGIAKSGLETELLIEKDMAHFALCYNMFTPQEDKLTKAVSFVTNTKMLNQVYEACGLSAFRVAYEIAVEKMWVGIYEEMSSFLFEKEEFDYLYERQALFVHISREINSQDTKQAAALFFYQYYKNKGNKQGMNSIREIFPFFSKARWQLGNKTWAGKTYAQVKMELK